MDHKHLIVRAETDWVPPGTVEGISMAEKFITELILELDMRPMFGPLAKYCTMPGNRGMTAFAIIETSHIVLHTWDEVSPHLVQLDIYTCSDMRVEQVLNHIKGWFGPCAKLEWKFLDRENDLNIVESGMEEGKG